MTDEPIAAREQALIERLQVRERELQRALDEVQQANRDLEQFVQVAAHDLRAPLRTVGGFAELLLERHADQLEPEARRFLDHIEVGVEQMRELLEDLLVYARSGAAELDFEPVDLGDLTAATLAGLSVAVEDAGALITVGDLPSVLGDRVQLGQLVQNLLSNAIKYRGEESPRVEVAATRQGAWWQLSVQDNGIGIDPQYSAAIFDTFRRLHGVGEYPGTGVGLAICRRTVQRHGGRIWADSEPGRGTTFHCTLPALPGTE
jgi:light-regulated signal transduction histidine kinase (bacteriophytochrome)